MIEVYRGSPNTWECDEIGHLNVRFYIARMMQGLGVFAHETEMPHAFRSNSPSTLAPRDQHIRFVNECMAGCPLHMRAGVIEITETSVLLYQELIGEGGRIAAAFRTWVDHIDTITRAPFPWTPRTLAAFDRLRVDPPAEYGPRSVDMNAAPAASPRMETVARLSAPCTGTGMIEPADCNIFGHAQPHFFIGRISDCVPNLVRHWLDDVAHAASPTDTPLNIGTVALEYRLVYREWPRSGDMFRMYSGTGPQLGKAYSMNHWFMNPQTGRAWATAQSIVVNFDITARKVVATPAPQMEALARLAPRGLDV